jgi:hypothetical protein
MTFDGPDYGSGQGVPINGTLVILVIDDLIVGHQRGMTVSETNEPVDYSSKERRERRVGYGRYESTISMEALYVPNSSGYLAIQDASRNGVIIEIIRKENGSDYETAFGVISSVSSDFPDQGESVLSIDIDIDGPWAPAGS